MLLDRSRDMDRPTSDLDNMDRPMDHGGPGFSDDRSRETDLRDDRLRGPAPPEDHSRGPGSSEDRSRGPSSDDRSNEPPNINDASLKPIEFTMKGEGNVEDAINRIQGDDRVDSDKLLKHITNKNMNSYEPSESVDEHNTFHDSLSHEGIHRETYPKEDENMHDDSYMKEKYNHHSVPSSQEYPENQDYMPEPTKGGMSMDDMLDPEKAQERADRLSAQAELQKKLGEQQHEYRDEPINQHFSKPIIDINDELPPKNPRQLSKQEMLPAKQLSDVVDESKKSEELSPEDALHALNGKKMLNEILSAGKEDDYYGPPDAVVNAQSGHSAFINQSKADHEVTAISQIPKLFTNTSKNFTTSEKKDGNGNSTSVNNDATKKEIKVPNGVAISELENATVTKEVVSILESIGQLKLPTNSSVSSDSQVQNNTQHVASNSNSHDNKTENKENEQPQIKETVDQNNNKTIFSNSSVDTEEQETKEAVHDLNIAISILEKKLALINEAKKSGNKKAIYIVDETLRNTKPVTKSSIATNAALEKFKLSNSGKLTNSVQRADTRDMIQRHTNTKGKLKSKNHTLYKISQRKTKKHRTKIKLKSKNTKGIGHKREEGG